MNPSAAASRIVARFEGLRLEAYLCPAGVWTIGYGHTRSVKKGDRISESQAFAYLLEDLEEAAKPIRMLVKQPLNQNQFDALCSFVLNVGAGNFGKSTLLILLNKGSFKEVAKQFSLWVHGGGKRLPGLVTRRAAEADLFLKPQEQTHA